MAVSAAGTVRSSEPTTKSEATRSWRAAVAAGGESSPAASVATVSTVRLRAAARSAAPPPIECPATAVRDPSTFPRGTTVPPARLSLASHASDRLRSSANRLGSRCDARLAVGSDHHDPRLRQSVERARVPGRPGQVPVPERERRVRAATRRVRQPRGEGSAPDRHRHRLRRHAGDRRASQPGRHQHIPTVSIRPTAPRWWIRFENISLVLFLPRISEMSADQERPCRLVEVEGGKSPLPLELREVACRIGDERRSRADEDRDEAAPVLVRKPFRNDRAGRRREFPSHAPALPRRGGRATNRAANVRETTPCSTSVKVEVTVPASRDLPITHMPGGGAQRGPNAGADRPLRSGEGAGSSDGFCRVPLVQPRAWRRCWGSARPSVWSPSVRSVGAGRRNGRQRERRCERGDHGCQPRDGDGVVNPLRWHLERGLSLARCLSVESDVRPGRFQGRFRRATAGSVPPAGRRVGVPDPGTARAMARRRRGFLRRAEAACSARRAPPSRQRGRPRWQADRRALG